MVAVMAFVIGSLFAGAAYLMLRRSVVKLILGVILLSHGANLLIFLMGDGVRTGAPAFIDKATEEVPAVWSDPLAQALILTAIVISFGILSFVLALAYRVDQTVKSDDLDDMVSTDQI